MKVVGVINDTISQHCYIGRHDECTERGFRRKIPPCLSSVDLNPCKCSCKHKPTQEMNSLEAEAYYTAGMLE